MSRGACSEIKTLVGETALSLGFSGVGFASCEAFDRLRLAEWFAAGHAGPLGYLSPERASGIERVFPNVKTAIVVTFPYARPDAVPGGVPGGLKLSRYLWGPDYHWIIKSRLHELLGYIRVLAPGTSGRVCVDTAPIMERALAVRAGLGWQGKNTMLIAGGQGSWLFLGVLLVDLEIEPDTPFEGDRCGNCTRCIDACPTKALGTFSLDCRRCLTTWTIEREGSPPKEVSDAISKTGWVAGCDVCQEVCPWNRSPTWGDAGLWGGPGVLHALDAVCLGCTPRIWKKTVEGTALRRVRFRHWASNLDMALGADPAATASPIF